MRLIISSPEHTVYDDTVTAVTIPTQIGEITVLPGHQPLASVIRAGALQIHPTQMPSAESGYTIQDGKIYIAVSKGLLVVANDTIYLTTSVASSSALETAETLEQMRQDTEAKIAQIRVEGNQADLELALENLEKITADLRVAKMGHVIH